jgi:hypothetical protein
VRKQTIWQPCSKVNLADIFFEHFFRTFFSNIFFEGGRLCFLNTPRSFRLRSICFLRMVVKKINQNRFKSRTHGKKCWSGKSRVLVLVSCCAPGLPDGIFSNQKSIFWVNFRRSCYGKYIGICTTRTFFILRLFGIACGHLEHFVVIWYIFFSFWYVAPIKIWQPCCVLHFASK